MNSCILMAEIVEEPQLRYTPDQTALAEMLVQFPGPRAEDAPATLKVVGWGNLAQQIQQQYHQGDRVIIEGRLSMNTIDRPEGFKEKRAELTVQRIHSLGDGVSISSSVTATTTDNSNSADMSVSSRTPEKALTETQILLEYLTHRVLQLLQPVTLMLLTLLQPRLYLSHHHASLRHILPYRTKIRILMTFHFKGDA
jgi:single-stranded DNA-binding protein